MDSIDRRDPIHTRALISVQIDYRQYRALLSLAQESESGRATDYYRQAALNLRHQAQLGAWILTGEWPVRRAR